jgi:hypothetical protein
MPPVGTRDYLTHCPRELPGALVAPMVPAPPAAVATAAFERECAVMGIHRAHNYCFLVAVTQSTTADAPERSRVESARDNRLRLNLGCCSVVLAAAQDSPPWYCRRTAWEEGPEKTDDCDLVRARDGERASSCEYSQQPAGHSIDLDAALL